jgi:two-component system phosphate regulon response regulator PhoB
MASALPPRARLLVAEDDASIRDMLRLLLEEAGCQVTLVATAEEACTLLEKSVFDLVLADSFALHRLEALGPTGPIRAAAGTTPVILCTGHRVTLEEALAAGFQGLLTKPFAIDDLLNQVGTLLRQQD